MTRFMQIVLSHALLVAAGPRAEAQEKNAE
jgi:hypothetical protein